MKYEIELKTAKEAVLLAGRKLKEFKTSLDIKYKEAKDIVTAADLASQSLIVETIKKSFPDDYILTEEGLHSFNNDRTWVTDPLDGTVNYSRNIPIYGVSIALFEKGEVKVAVTYLPVYGELYYAVKGFGCYCNDKKISVSNNEELDKAIININDFNIGSGKMIEEYNNKKVDLVNKLHNSCMRLKNFSSAVLEFAYVASGKIDAYFMIFCGYWDIAAGILMIEEAGGKVTDFEGNRVEYETKFVLASNGKLHYSYIDLVK